MIDCGDKPRAELSAQIVAFGANRLENVVKRQRKDFKIPCVMKVEVIYELENTCEAA